MCQPHPHGGGGVGGSASGHSAELSKKQMRGCIGVLEEAVGLKRANDKDDLLPCFDYLRRASDHFENHPDRD